MYDKEFAFNIIYSIMESEEYSLRLEVCEKCYEHELIDKHSENPFIEAYEDLKEVCGKLGIKIIKNVPPKYLIKAAATKFCSRRFVDANTGKVYEFPRRGAFEVYFFNVLIFSKFQSGNFPDKVYLTEVLEQVKAKVKSDPTLSGMERFRNIEYELKRNYEQIEPLYTYLKLIHSQDLHNQSLEQILAKMNGHTKTQRKKAIYPYSFYAKKQKQGKMSSIYCPSDTFIHRQKHLPPTKSKYMEPIQKQSSTRPKSQTKPSIIKSELFQMVLHGADKEIDSKNLKAKLSSEDMHNFKKQSKQLYISFLACTKKNKLKQEESKKFLTTHRRGNSSACRGKVKNPSEIFKRATTATVRQNSEIIKRTSPRTKLNDDKNTQPNLGIQSKLISCSLKQKQLNDLISTEVKKSMEQIILSCQSKIPQYINSAKQQSEREEQERKMVNRIIQQRKKYSIHERFSSRHSRIDKQQFEGMGPQKKRQKTAQNQSIIQSESEQCNFSSHSINKAKNTKLQLQKLNLLQKKSSKSQKQNLKLWNELQEGHNYEERAVVSKKFSEQKHFSEDLFAESKQKIENLTEFVFEGIELKSRFVVKSIRNIYSPKEVKFFPEILKQVEGYETKLSQLINFLVKANQLAISRIFENKKMINPSGIYCVWLMNPNGLYHPVYINDEFAFHQNLNPIYAGLVQNSIWFMILEKAVAKLLGGYDILAEASLSTLLNIILGCPVVDFGSMTPHKLLKAFDENIFYNKMATFYVYRSYSEDKEKNKVQRVIGFNKDYSNLNNSFVNIKRGDKTISITLKQFILSYDQITLAFFSNFYFFNQVNLKRTSNTFLISCRLSSSTQRNNCYLMMSGFPTLRPTKVTLYRKLTDEEAQITEGMNPLSQQRKRYQYVGEITKCAKFFFEVQLSAGQYMCLFESSFKYESNPHFSVFSQHPIKLFSNDIHSLPLKNIKANSQVNENISGKNKEMKGGQQREEIPKFLIEKRIVMEKSNGCGGSSRQTEFVIKKKFLVDDDCEQKQNSFFVPSK